MYILYVRIIFITRCHRWLQPSQKICHSSLAIRYATTIVKPSQRTCVFEDTTKHDTQIRLFPVAMTIGVRLRSYITQVVFELASADESYIYLFVFSTFSARKISKFEPQRGLVHVRLGRRRGVMQRSEENNLIRH